MKKTNIALFLTTAIASGTALAGKHTVSVGYAQAQIKGFESPHGINLQYRSEIVNTLGILNSLTYVKSSQFTLSGGGAASHQVTDNRVDTRYMSLLMGPVYRVNDIISLYTLGGFARFKAHASFVTKPNRNTFREKDLYATTRTFAYGAGVIINPTENLSINAGYEGARFSFVEDSKSKLWSNGFNVGLGYRF